MILGCILILIGIPFAATNWYSIVSEAISAKHSSMVPPVGGLLFLGGIYSITGSWTWALIGIPADIGMVVFIILIPSLVREMYSRSRFTLIQELHAWRDGHRTILKLYKDSGAELTFSDGPTRYGINGRWTRTHEGYVITFGEHIVCELTRNEGGFDTREVERSVGNDGPNLEGLTFEPMDKPKQG